MLYSPYCLYSQSIYHRTWPYLLDSCTNQTHPSILESHHHPQLARIEPVSRRGLDAPAPDALLIQEQASLAAPVVHLHIPTEPISHLHGATELLTEHTPLTRSKINLIATQNSSKSKFPSLSTSARSHIRSSFS